MIDPDWAVANLTTWLVWVGVIGAVANLAVVVTAFWLQRNDHRRANRERANLHVAALQSCANSLEIFDVAIGGKNNVRADVSKSDIIGRLNVFKSSLDYYLGQGIIDPNIVNVLLAFVALYERTLSDLESIVPISTDRIAGYDLDRLYAHRKALRDGADKMLKLAFQIRAEI